MLPPCGCSLCCHHMAEYHALGCYHPSDHCLSHHCNCTTTCCAMGHCCPSDYHYAAAWGAAPCHATAHGAACCVVTISSQLCCPLSHCHNCTATCCAMGCCCLSCCCCTATHGAACCVIAVSL